jgi:hypothetical protein
VPDSIYEAFSQRVRNKKQTFQLSTVFHALFICRYNTRIYNLLRDFGPRLSDVDAICRYICAQCHEIQPHLLSNVLHKIFSRSSSEFFSILNFMSNLDENQMIEVASKAIGKTSSAHMKFREYQKKQGHYSTAIHRKRIKVRRQMNNTASTVAQPIKTNQPLNVHDSIGYEKHATSVDAAHSALHDNKNVQARELTSQSVPVADIREALRIKASPSVKSGTRYRAASAKLEEVVVLPGDAPIDLS